MGVILLCLLVAIYFDIVLFKRRDSWLFEKVFKLSLLKAVLGIAFVSIVLIFSPDRWEDLPPLVFLFILPMYLLRRSRFVKSLDRGAGDKIPILLSSALGVVIVWGYGITVFGLFMSAVASLFPGSISEMGDLVLSALFSSLLIISLVYQSSQHFSPEGFWANVDLRKKGRSWASLGLVPAALGIGFAFLSSYLALARHVQPRTPLGDVFDATESFSLVVVFLLLAIAVAPFVEEIVFRGYFFRIAQEWLGGRKAVYLIAMTFAVLHVGQYWGDWLAIAMVAALGLTLTALRAQTGSTIASVVAHYVYNASVTVIPIVMIALTNPAYFEYQAYYHQHDAQAKEALLKESIAKNPDLADAYNDLAWLYAQEGMKLDVAMELIEKALSYAPEYPIYLDTKAEILEKQGRHEEAKSIRLLLR